MKSIFTFIKSIAILLLISSTVFAQADNCSATFVVENNGYVRSAPITGTYYSLILTNNGPSDDTYNLVYLNDNTASLKNPDDSSSENNVNLLGTFLNTSKSVIKSVFIRAGENVGLFLAIKVPASTGYDLWSTSKISAISNKCSSYQVDATLHTIVIDVSEY